MIDSEEACNYVVSLLALVFGFALLAKLALLTVG